MRGYSTLLKIKIVSFLIVAMQLFYVSETVL